LTVTGRGIWTPDDGDNFDFTVDLGAMAESIDDAIDDVETDIEDSLADNYPPRFPSKSALDGWQPQDGAIAFVTADNRHYVRLNSEWRGVAGPDYSTTEVDTGRRWVDGKTIYGRTVTGTITRAANSREFTVLATGADALIKAEGYWRIQGPNGAKESVAGAYGGDSRGTLYHVSTVYETSAEIRLVTNSSEARTNAPYAVYVEYTKL